MRELGGNVRGEGGYTVEQVLVELHEGDVDSLAAVRHLQRQLKWYSQSVVINGGGQRALPMQNPNQSPSPASGLSCLQMWEYLRQNVTNLH